MKSSNQNHPFSRPLFYLTFILSVIVWVLDIVLIVMEGVFGLVGFNNTTSISSACDAFTQTYYYVKYNNNNSTIVKLCFVSSLIAVICSTVLTITMLVLLVKLVKEEVVVFRKSVKVRLYIFCSLLILATMIPAGYYLAFSKQLTPCTVTSYNSSQVQAVAIIAFIIVGIALLIWLLLLFYFYQRVSSQEKYREITSNQTEPQQKAQIYKNYEEKPKKQPEHVYNTTHQKEQARRELYKLEETHQNLYESPYNKKQQTHSKLPVENINGPTKNISILQSRGGLINYQRRYTPQRSYNKEADNNPGQLVFFKEKRQPPMSRDQQEYKQYQKQYLSRNKGGRAILTSNGIQQRKFKGTDYNRSTPEPARLLSPFRNEKQGVLVKHIRSKYAG